VYPFADSDFSDIGDYMCAGTSFIQGRDGYPPAIPFKYVGKLNDKLRRKYSLTS
jgi:hypothetical protein